MSTPRTSSFGFGLSLSLGLVLSSWLICKACLDIKSLSHHIFVKGYAERKITSEQTSWSGTLTTRDPSLTEAHKKIAHNREIVIAFLVKAGFKAEQVEASPVIKNTLYALNDKGNQTNLIEGYSLTQGFSIDSRDVALMAKLAKEIDRIQESGIDFESHGVRYYYPSDKLEHLKIELLGEATKSAQERAEQFAKNTSCTVGRLLSAAQGVFQVTGINSSNISDYGVYDTSSLVKVVRSVVTLSYAIAK